MAQDLSTSITRRSLVAGLALSAAPVGLAGADNAYAQAKETTKETTSEKSLYERLGGVFAIASFSLSRVLVSSTVSDGSSPATVWRSAVSSWLM